jgi:hypothetical protein
MKLKKVKKSDVDSKIYTAWNHVKNRGIAFAKEWETLAGFYSWVITSNYEKELYFVRIDSCLL